MTTELNLGSIKLDGGVWSLGNYSLGSADQGASVSVASGKPLVQGLGAYGTLRTDADGDNLTLVGGSELKGAVSIGGLAAASISAINFGGAPVSVSLGSGFDKLTNVKMGGSADTVNVSLDNKDFNLNTGAGNDMVIIESVNASSKIDLGAGNDVVSVTGATGEVVLGAGKDTVKFGNNATVNLTDYNFADDVIELADAVLTNDGKVQKGSSVVSGLTATNGVFLARTTDGSKTTVLATAEKDTTKAVINASSIKENEVVIINATSADSANITLGKASTVAVSLNSDKDAGVDTITIGDTKAKASITVTNFNTDDVLSFTGLAFDKTTIDADGSANVTLSSGKISLNLGNQVTLSTGTNGAKFNLNGTALYAATASDAELDLTGETDLSKILVKGRDSVAAASIKASAQIVNLSAENIYNINGVKLTADTVAKASVIGTKNDTAGITIDASDATDGVAVWANNSSTSKGDMITLSASTDVADTLWFGSADGKDSVTNFSLASDVLYLADATALTAEDGNLKLSKTTEMSLMSSIGAEEIMQVQGAKFAGTFYVAGDFVSDDDKAIKLGDNAGKVNYYAVAKDAKVSVASSEAINYTFLKDIDYAGASKANIAANGSVASINASGVDSTDSKIIIEGVANVSLGAGTNEVWVNGAAKDATVVLSTGKGTDKVWFGASDKNVTVTGFDTDTDVIALMGSIGEFSAKMDETSSSVVISNASKKALTLSDVRENVSLVDAADAKYKLFVNDAIYTTNTDGTNIYLDGNLTAGSDVTGATNIVVEGANNKWGIASSAIVGKAVKDINMSGSSADFVLIGSANASNTITGGMGTNYLNGGGASKDVLYGNTGAVDFFYYGKEDGNDTLMNVGVEDEVRMYDIATTDIAAIKDGADKTVITLNNDSKLTIDGSIEGITFALADATYKYDSSVEGKWVKK